MFFLDADGTPLVRSSRRLGLLPLISEQKVEIAHVPFDWIGGPSAFDAGRYGEICLALHVRVQPAEALGFNRRAFRCRAKGAGIAVAMCLADRVAAAGERGSFLVIHCHAGKGFADFKCGLRRIERALDTLRIDVDEAHLHSRKRILQRVRLGVVVIAVAAQPFLFGAPIGVDFGMPDVRAAKGEAVGFQAHGFIRNRARQDDQVGPGNLVAVFLFDRPQQAAGLVEVAIVRPGIERSEADIARTATAATVGQTVGTCRVPGKADHQAAIMAIVGRPPFLIFRHQGGQVFLQRCEVERLDLLAIVKVFAERVRLGVVLVQDVEVQRIRPPIHHRAAHSRHPAMHHRTLAGAWLVISIHIALPLLKLFGTFA